MFVGHYSASYAGKRLAPTVPLWVLFVAAQLVDVLWSFFVLSGVEKLRIVPGFTALSPLDLYYMPYTHSLIGAIFWSVLAYGAWRLYRKNRNAAIVVGLAVFSHWVLDLLVHRPDLTLYDTMKLGLGLWNHPAIELPLEFGLLAAGIAYYMRGTTARTKAARFAMPLFGAVMILVQLGSLVGPPPPSPRAMAVTAFIAYAALALVAGLLERGRAGASRGAESNV